jgi:hypothetical protein
MTDQIVYFTGAVVWLLLICCLFVVWVLLISRAINTTVYLVRILRSLDGWADILPYRGSRLLRLPVSWGQFFMEAPEGMVNLETGERIYWPGRELKEPSHDR